ncbi:enoyl-CoA hydratase/isomerase family protein [Colwellia sp. D2M02]|uniref:enoyl-CoA hydratase-related protein n=1 Tax=Colwellia sp. D2M02 TaxID=2841562 RepID=UPI001C087BAB|nr:enoyl-CoA hydratase-related protein [Colwellia sp. D2M02]MBU2893839.1 enoyl-CoA hydratase/isomerase family protein [Colwellia sp. D2M02]
MPTFQFLTLTLVNRVLHLQLARPEKANAMNKVMWFEIGEVYRWIATQDNIHAVVLSGKGKQFSSGADINFLLQVMESTENFQGDKTEHLRLAILNMQQSFSAIAECPVPTIAAIHGVCVGGAIDLISACDIRLASYRSYFSIMETQLGIPADMGTLQRLHSNLSNGQLRELAFTAAIFSGRKAKQWGLINNIYFTRKGLMKAAFKLANTIAELPSYAVQATKRSLNVNTNAIVAEGLDTIATINAELLPSPAATSQIAALKTKLKKS